MLDYFKVSQEKPELKALSLISSAWVFYIVQFAIKSNILVELDKEPQDAIALSKKVDITPSILSRILRGLSHLSVVVMADSKFNITSVGRLLLPTQSDGFYAMADLWGEEFSKSWTQIDKTVKQGISGFELVYQRDLFGYLQQHPKRAGVFINAMDSIAKLLYPEVVKHIKVESGRTIADIGGGNGYLISLLLKENENSQGILFDVDRVIGSVEDKFIDFKDRLTLVVGDFFKSIPKADSYIMSNVLHDWPDQHALAILHNIRKNQQLKEKLYIVEMAIDHEVEPFLATSTDLNMLMLTGGKERTLSEFNDLFDLTGYKLLRVTNIKNMTCLIEVEAI